MRARPFTIKRGDLSPVMDYQLLPATVSLVGITSIRFRMQPRGGMEPTTIDAEAVVVQAGPPAIVRYVWQAGDTAIAREYEGEFKIVYGDGAPETFPNGDFIPVVVFPDVPAIPEEEP